MPIECVYRTGTKTGVGHDCRMSLFRLGEEIFKKFGLSAESEMTFSDYCRGNIYLYKDRIKFTSKSLLFFHPMYGTSEHASDDWIDCESIEFYPWSSVIGFQNIEGMKVLKEYNKKDITAWLATIEDYEISYPFVDVRRGNMAYVNLGMPKSTRSRGWKKRITEDVIATRTRVSKVLPQPWKHNVEMKIDVFFDGTGEYPDLDHLAEPITNAFEGLAYDNDKQIRDLRPRMIDVSKAYQVLECKTNPMSSFSVDHMPTGSMYPLSLGILNYYTVRLMFYY